ncbi:MAG: hypothetical protein WB507_08875 [Solirubrobacterales bacterium]
MPLLVLLVVVLGATILALGGIDTGVLDLLPAALLVAVMLAFPYPATALIDHLAGRQRQHRANLAPRLRPAPRVRLGSCLISLSLGGRAPPALAGTL